MLNWEYGSRLRGKLRHIAIVLLLAATSAGAHAESPEPSHTVLPTLTTALEIHSLTYEESLRRYPVRLHRATVLNYNPAVGNLFVSDSSHGVFLDMRKQPTLPLHVGDIVEVEGVTGPGGFAPDVEEPKVRIVGKGPLPTAKRVSMDRLLTGVEDCQWVEVEGIVRSVRLIQPVTAYANQAASGGVYLLVTIATGAGKIDIITQDAAGIDYSNLVDAEVLVRGVAGPRFNLKRQLTGIRMSAASLAHFRVLKRAPMIPYSLPVRDVNTVMRYTPDNAPGHRIRVRAVVTANRDGRLLSVADETHGLFIHAENAGDDLKVGDLIDVVGFPAMGDYTPILEDVIYRRVGKGTLPAPIPITASEIFKGGADAELVRIRGRLLNQTQTPPHTLLITAEGHTFTAVMPAGEESTALASLPDGSILELTGTCFVDVFPDKTPKTVQIILRSPQDVLVLQRPPWWTVRHAFAALGVLLVIVLASFGWVTMLRQRVRIQTAALREAEQKTEAIGDLARAMHEVTTRKNFAARVSAAGDDEIAELGLGFNEMLTELEQGDLAKREAEAKLQRQALTDELTGLPNRRLLSDRLSQALAIAQREEHIVALLYIDLDGFKLINDSLGHTVGDLLLSQIAERLRSRIRLSDTLARVGGDEFTVVLTILHDKADADLVANNLLDVFTERFSVEGHEITIGASVGISFFPDNGADAVSLLQQADNAMYAAKRKGKNQIMHFTAEMGSAVRERLDLENQLRGAVERGEISVHYQPEFDVASRRLVRFEALARWTNPALGTIPPAKFIPVAEECGLIRSLGTFLMEKACREAARWQTAASYPIQVAVNVSCIQFVHPDFVEEVVGILQHTQLKPSLLQIELTESIMLSGAERVAETMRRLRTLGINLAIDDFGTGYSCLSYLPRLPFNTLKIDRSFVSGIESRPGTGAMVHSLVTLAHNLGMRVIVEGVETAQQLEVINKFGGNEVQGFLLGHPTPDPMTLLRAGLTALTASEYPNDIKLRSDSDRSIENTVVKHPVATQR